MPSTSIAIPPRAAAAAAPGQRAGPGTRRALAERFSAVRSETLARAAPLSSEDLCVQSMPDASPGKWHLAHTSWFFETLLLLPHAAGYRAFDPSFGYLFNSYYEALGARHPRPARGLLTRPPVEAVYAYRAHVDDAMRRLIEQADAAAWSAIAALLELGLQHEQQHQELLLTDALHLLSCNPLLPAYRPAAVPPALHLARPAPERATAPRFIDCAGGFAEIGHAGGDGFSFDNETPRHRTWLRDYRIAARLVTCGEYAAFIADGGYREPALWLSDGWAAVQAGGWQAPLYWVAPDDPRARGGDWQVFGLHGLQALDPAAPVAQLSFYEAAAFAHWSGARLPTEFEWEAAYDAPGILQMTGHVWQWTRSSYDPYPGFQPLAGAVGEYNGKFMVGQIVLRGGSAATPAGHARRSYRNFFPPGARWQFSGLRLAQDAGC